MPRLAIRLKLRSWLLLLITGGDPKGFVLPCGMDIPVDPLFDRGERSDLTGSASPLDVCDLFGVNDVGKSEPIFPRRKMVELDMILITGESWSIVIAGHVIDLQS